MQYEDSIAIGITIFLRIFNLLLNSSAKWVRRSRSQWIDLANQNRRQEALEYFNRA
jgi:hypothetical protein